MNDMSTGAREPLRIGLLGAARIAPPGIIEPARATGHRLVAVAARDPRRAETFADRYGIERVVADYDALIADPEVDVIYNALHNGAHVPLNIRALRAGKHVLTEKPSAVDAAEARELAAVAAVTDRVFMEGFHYLHHPAVARAIEVAASGEIGEVTGLESTLTTAEPPADDLRWNYALAGGCLMDLGCYAVHVQLQFARRLFGAPPTVLSAIATPRADGVDHDVIDASMTVTLSLPNGATGVARSDMAAPGYEAPLIVRGERGEVRLLLLWKVRLMC
jgi:predicted dehydrogenase